MQIKIIICRKVLTKRVSVTNSDNLNQNGTIDLMPIVNLCVLLYCYSAMGSIVNRF